MSRINNSARDPLLCYVTDRRSLPDFELGKARETLLSKIQAAARAGVDWIQIREKDLSGRDCTSLAQEVLLRAAKSPARNGASARILVNDRLDVALSERAGGVHLGEKSLPPSEARRLVNAVIPSQDFLIGASCHSLEAARSAASDGADYLFFGPIFTTPSKAAFGAPQKLWAVEANLWGMACSKAIFHSAYSLHQKLAAFPHVLGEFEGTQCFDNRIGGAVNYHRRKANAATLKREGPHRI